MKYNYILPAIAIFVLSVSAYTQQTWSLEQCIQYAIQNNIQVKQKQLDIDVSKETVVASRAAFYPTLNGSADQGFSWRKSSTTNNYATSQSQNTSLDISSEVIIYQGFKLRNELKRDQLNLSAKLAEIDKIKNDISLNVASTYLQIIYYQELLKVSQNQQNISQKQVERMQLLVDAGKSTRGNLLEVQAQLEQDKLKIITDENNVRSAYLTMKQLLELKDSVQFVVVAPQLLPQLSEHNLPPVDTVFNAAIHNLPEFKSLDYQIQSANRSLDIAKSGKSPVLTAYAGYSTYYSDGTKRLNMETLTYEDYPMSSQFVDNQNKSLSLSLVIPIFNNRQVETGINKAKIAIEYAKTNLQLTRNTVYKDIQTAHNEAQASYRKFIASQKVVEATTESFSYTEQKFTAGVLTAIEYNTAKSQLAKVQNELLQARFDYMFRLAVLDFYMGKAISIN